MQSVFIIPIILAVVIFAFLIVRILFSKNAIAQRQLNRYLGQRLSADEIGKFYERYIGYLYETEGYEVEYHGAIKGFADLGRDLIVRCANEVFVIQTKCWAKSKLIQEKHIFQLFGTMTHFKLTYERAGRPTKAVIYTTAKYSNTAKDAARVLGVELRTEALNRSYPMVKCSVSAQGEKRFYLPFDSNYDKVKIDLHRQEYFVKTVKEAVDKGFKRAG